MPVNQAAEPGDFPHQIAISMFVLFIQDPLTKTLFLCITSGPGLFVDHRKTNTATHGI